MIPLRISCVVRSTVLRSVNSSCTRWMRSCNSSSWPGLSSTASGTSCACSLAVSSSSDSLKKSSACPLDAPPAVAWPGVGALVGTVSPVGFSGVVVAVGLLGAVVVAVGSLGAVVGLLGAVVGLLGAVVGLLGAVVGLLGAVVGGGLRGVVAVAGGFSDAAAV